MGRVYFRNFAPFFWALSIFETKDFALPSEDNVGDIHRQIA